MKKTPVQCNVNSIRTAAVNLEWAHRAIQFYRRVKQEWERRVRTSKGGRPIGLKGLASELDGVVFDSMSETERAGVTKKEMELNAACLNAAGALFELVPWLRHFDLSSSTAFRSLTVRWDTTQMCNAVLLVLRAAWCGDTAIDGGTYKPVGRMENAFRAYKGAVQNFRILLHAISNGPAQNESSVITVVRQRYSLRPSALPGAPYVLPMLGGNPALLNILWRGEFNKDGLYMRDSDSGILVLPTPAYEQVMMSGDGGGGGGGGGGDGGGGGGIDLSPVCSHCHSWRECKCHGEHVSGVSTQSRSGDGVVTIDFSNGRPQCRSNLPHRLSMPPIGEHLLRFRVAFIDPLEYQEITVSNRSLYTCAGDQIVRHSDTTSDWSTVLLTYGVSNDGGYTLVVACSFSFSFSFTHSPNPTTTTLIQGQSAVICMAVQLR